jgi:hypothetical protein
MLFSIAKERSKLLPAIELVVETLQWNQKMDEAIQTTQFPKRMLG